MKKLFIFFSLAILILAANTEVLGRTFVTIGTGGVTGV